MHAGSFHVSIIHRTPTWTTVSLTCVRDHSEMHACVYVHTGVGHTDRESAQHLWPRKTLTNLSCAPDSDRVRTSGLWIWSLMLYQLTLIEPLRHPDFHDTSETIQINHKNVTLVIFGTWLNNQLKKFMTLVSIKINMELSLAHIWKVKGSHSDRYPFSGFLSIVFSSSLLCFLLPFWQRDCLNINSEHDEHMTWTKGCS